MDLKPTLWRVIISIIIGIIITFLFKDWLLVKFFPSRALAITEGHGYLDIFYGVSWFYLLIILVIAIIVYLIWSLIQKK